MNDFKGITGNKRLILNTLYQEGRASKAQLAKKLKLSKPSVSENVASLISSGLVLEVGIGEASRQGGRKPLILEFNKNYKYILCIDLSLEYPICAVGNLNYELLMQSQIKIGDGLSSLERKQAVLSTFRTMLAELHIERDQVGVAVISTPGIVKNDGSYLHSNPQFKKWVDINLKEFLEQSFDIAVLVKNDVNLAVMAEKSLGLGKNSGSIMFVSCGLGLGSGLILDGRIFEGKHFAAGEIGYFIDNENDEHSLEEKVRLAHVKELVYEALNSGKETMLNKDELSDDNFYESLQIAYNKGDKFLKDLFYSIGLRLGVAISNASSLLDLEIVILGGIYTDFSKDILKAIKSVNDKAKLFKPVIKSSRLGSLGSIYGAFVLGSEVIIT